MSSKFTVPKDLVTVRVNYGELGNGEIVIFPTKADEEKFTGDIKTATAKFARPGWHQYNNYIDQTIVTDRETGQAKVDLFKLRDKKLRVLLRELVDGDNENVPIIPLFFNECIPEFAIALIDGYDNIVDEERARALREKGILVDLEDLGIPAEYVAGAQSQDDNKSDEKEDDKKEDKNDYDRLSEIIEKKEEDTQEK